MYEEIRKQVSVPLGTLPLVCQIEATTVIQSLKSSLQSQKLGGCRCQE